MITTSVYKRLREVVLLGAVIVPLLTITTNQLESQAPPSSGAHMTVQAATTAQLGTHVERCFAAYKPGTYGFIGLGQELVSNPFGEPAGPIASLLVVRSNGDGTLTVQRTDFANGVLVVTPTVPGTYSVGDDCTVMDSIPIPGAWASNALTGYGVIVQDGAEVNYMATTPGVVVQNYVGRRMPEYCTDAILEGVYGLSGVGTMLSTNPFGLPAGPSTTISTLYFDGKGNFRKENEEVFINGNLFSIGSLRGTYSVNSDCRFTITATTADNFTATGVVVDRGNLIDFIPTTPGALVATVVGKKIVGASTTQTYGLSEPMM